MEKNEIENFFFFGNHVTNFITDLETWHPHAEV